MTHPSRISKGMYWDEAWSLVSGCTHVSPGCDNCWSAKETHMRASNPNKKVSARNEGLTENGCFNGQIRLNYEFLDKPLQRKKPTVYAVWNDLFHEDVPFEFIDHAFAVMALCTQHTFLILTKRPERMLEYMNFTDMYTDKLGCLTEYMEGYGWISPEDVANYTPPGSILPSWPKWPLPNVWLGVTAENQEQADKRIPILLQTPAAVRFVSVEPVLGPIGLTDLHFENVTAIDALNGLHGFPKPHAEGPKLDWVVCGTESGSNRRPAQLEWITSLRDQCQAARTPFFLKQMEVNGELVKMPELDGRTWHEFPK
jgi:protein gp37